MTGYIVSTSPQARLAKEWIQASVAMLREFQKDDASVVIAKLQAVLDQLK